MDTDAECSAAHIMDEILASGKDSDAMGVELRAFLDGLKNNKQVEAILPYVAEDITAKDLNMGPKLNYAVRAALSKTKELKKSSARAPARASAKLSSFADGGVGGAPIKEFKLKSNVSRRPSAVVGRNTPEGWKVVPKGTPVMSKPFSSHAPVAMDRRDTLDTSEPILMDCGFGAMEEEEEEEEEKEEEEEEDSDEDEEGDDTVAPLPSTAPVSPAPTPAAAAHAVNTPPPAPITAPAAGPVAPKPAAVAVTKAPKPAKPRATGPLMSRADVEPLIRRLQKASEAPPADQVSKSVESLIRAVNNLAKDPNTVIILAECGALDPLVTLLDAEGQNQEVVYNGVLTLCYMGASAERSIVRDMGNNPRCRALALKLCGVKEQIYNASILVAYLANKDKGAVAAALLQDGALEVMLDVMDLVLNDDKEPPTSRTSPEVLLNNGIRALYHLVAYSDDGKQRLVEAESGLRQLNAVLAREGTCSPEDVPVYTSMSEGRFNTMVIISRLMSHSREAITGIAAAGLLETIMAYVSIEETPPDQLRLAISCLNNLSCAGEEGEGAFINAGGLSTLVEVLQWDVERLVTSIKLFTAVNNFTIDSNAAGEFMRIGGLAPLLACLASTSGDVRRQACNLLVNFTQVAEHQQLFWEADKMACLAAAVGSEDDTAFMASGGAEGARSQRYLLVAMGNIMLNREGAAAFTAAGGVPGIMRMLAPQGTGADPKQVESAARLGCILSQTDEGCSALHHGGVVAACVAILHLAEGVASMPTSVAAGPAAAAPLKKGRARRSSFMVHAPVHTEEPEEQTAPDDDWAECADRAIELLLHMSLLEEAKSASVQQGVLQLLCARLRADADPDPDAMPHPHINLAKLFFNMCHDPAAVTVVWAEGGEDWNEPDCSLKLLMRCGDPEIMELSTGILSILHNAH